MTLLSAVAAVEETPVDRFLAEQADLSAVARFAQRHAAELVPAQARYYRDLVPLTAPDPGQQYAFEVDLDACTGCKACVAACHSLNGLDDGESWRTVTTVTGTAAGGGRDGAVGGGPVQQTVTAACHHCVDPACLNGCPVDAYEKDPVTGIVVHLDDQCIGCSYCTLTCPYEVPVYNHSRGIVRKCDLCRGRLAEGEAPACVQACPNQAIAVRVIDTAAAREAALAEHSAVVAGMPSPAITIPSTVYVSASGRAASMAAATQARPAPARAHPPLAAMLVLTQLSVGAFITDLALGRSGMLHALVAVGAGMVALGASTLHLGRPQYAYRAVIGLRHSWLSREVVAFGAFTGLAFLHALGVLPAPVGWAAAAAGLFGIACSVLIYTVTRRAAWRPSVVVAKFLMTTVILGVAATAWASAVTGGHVPSAAAVVVAAFAVLKLAGEAARVRRPHPDLRRRAQARFACGGAAVALVPLAAIVPLVWTAVLGALVAGEYLERWLFFTTASPAR